MTKHELSNIIARETGITRECVTLVLDCAAEEIIKCLEAGGEYQQRHFGTFSVIQRKQKVARIIRTGEALIVPAHKTVKFKQCEEFEKRVRGEW